MIVAIARKNIETGKAERALDFSCVLGQDLGGLQKGVVIERRDAMIGVQ